MIQAASRPPRPTPSSLGYRVPTLRQWPASFGIDPERPAIEGLPPTWLVIAVRRGQKRSFERTTAEAAVRTMSNLQAMGWTCKALEPGRWAVPQ